ncbi:MAG: patatin-like phospholipase family protein [Roseiarcus sp.]|jgi:NTE family protein
MNAINRALAFVGLGESAPQWPPPRLSLALQGGGSFGAFTWGVLDRLLEERAVTFDAISGSSAGAVNAVLVASGLIAGGREEAKARLERFWKRMSVAAAFLPSASLSASPLGAGFGLVARSLSPYQFNPFNLNPLREALIAEVDFASLRARSPIKLLIGATRVRDGKLRVFTNGELTVDAVLASACLPLLHHTIEIGGESYWDGGYAANPPLVPLALASKADHLMIVQVTPNSTDRLPKTPRDIAKRLEQIHFNATLNSELEALKYGMILGATPKLRRLRVGRISAQDEYEGLANESAGNLGWAFLQRLQESGRGAVEVWLDEAAPRASAKSKGRGPSPLAGEGVMAKP